jgi:Molybdopterin cofactor-binding domain
LLVSNSYLANRSGKNTSRAALWISLLSEEIVLSGSGVLVREGEYPFLSCDELMQQPSPAWKSGVGSPEGEASHYYEAKQMSYPAGVQVGLVEVDRETEVVEVKKLWFLFDVGRGANPLLAERQIVGGIVQALGGVLSWKNFLMIIRGSC